MRTRLLKLREIFREEMRNALAVIADGMPGPEESSDAMAEWHEAFGEISAYRKCILETDQLLSQGLPAEEKRNKVVQIRRRLAAKKKEKKS